MGMRRPRLEAPNARQKTRQGRECRVAGQSLPDTNMQPVCHDPVPGPWPMGPDTGIDGNTRYPLLYRKDYFS